MLSATQKQFKDRQDKLRQEVSDLLAKNERDQALAHYQKTCCCNRVAAERFVTDLERERRQAFQERLLAKRRSYR